MCVCRLCGRRCLIVGRGGGGGSLAEKNLHGSLSVFS